jgi:hypothetical protein
MTTTAVRVAAAGSLIALATGLAIMLGGTLLTGDWYALRLPWSDIGMWLITIGLGGGLLFLAAENVVEPVGRWRLLALPGAAIGAWFWFILAVVGLGTGGACCDQPTIDIRTSLYSAPQSIAVLATAVGLTGLPLLLARPWSRGTR